MWKNYMLAALNVAVAGLPFLVGWDLVLYGVYCGFAVLLLGLTAWNPVGDWFSILFVFYAKAVPEEALIMPALRRYLREAISGKGYLKPKCRFYYAESRIPYFIPISRKRVVLSLALEDYLIRDYDGSLYGSETIKRPITLRRTPSKEAAEWRLCACDRPVEVKKRKKEG